MFYSLLLLLFLFVYNLFESVHEFILIGRNLANELIILTHDEHHFNVHAGIQRGEVYQSSLKITLKNFSKSAQVARTVSDCLMRTPTLVSAFLTSWLSV